MFFQSPLETKIEENEKKLEKLKNSIDALTESVDLLYEEHHVDEDKLHDYFTDSTNFSMEEWNLLNELLEENQKKVERNKLSNPLETKKKYSERVVDPRWLFIR